MWKLRKVPACGTSRGYDYHTRQLGEKPCTACRDAKRLDWQKKRQENRETLNAWRRNHRKTNGRSQYERDSSKRRRGHFVGDYSHKTVIDTYGSECYLCNKPIDLKSPRQVGVLGWELGLHIDHVIAISKGGLDTLANVRPAHAYCNQTKGAK
jgi:hypothetical protein